MSKTKKAGPARSLGPIPAASKLAKPIKIAKGHKQTGKPKSGTAGSIA